MDRRVSELLPFYVNGTLADEERAFVEARAAADPELAAELRWMQSLAARVRENVPAVSQEVGLERAMAMIRTGQGAGAKAGGERSRGVARASAPGFGERIKAWLAGYGLSPALAMAAALVLVQGGVILSLVRQAEDVSTEQMRSVPPVVQPVEVPTLRLNFKPEAREADIRMLLIELKADIVSGPGQLGDYYVRIDGDAGAAAQSARASALVEAAELVPGVPPKVR